MILGSDGHLLLTPHGLLPSAVQFHILLAKSAGQDSLVVSHLTPVLEASLVIYGTRCLIKIGVVVHVSGRNIVTYARVQHRSLAVHHVLIVCHASLVDRFLERQAILVENLVILIVLKIRIA